MTPPPPANSLRYSGPATLVRQAIYLHRGIIPEHDFSENIPGGSVFVTSSADRAIRDCMPCSAHRPAIGSLVGDLSQQNWNADAAIEQLKVQLRVGGAVCIQLERALRHIDITIGWSEEAGLGFAIGESEVEVASLVAEETRILVGLSLSIPSNLSPEFSLFDRATLLRLPGEERPVSVVTIACGTVNLGVAGRESSVHRERFRALTAGFLPDLPVPELIHSALDHTVAPLLGFLAAWAAIERIINTGLQEHLTRIEAAAAGDPPLLIAKVLVRRAAADYRPSITDNFLLMAFGLNSANLEGDESAFKQVNSLRQRIYHRGDLNDLSDARNQAVHLLRRLLNLLSGTR